MRCPKCQYISFGSVERCRNCGHEFLLAVDAAPLDLPIQSDQTIGPLGDFVLTERGVAGAGGAAAKTAVADLTDPEPSGPRRPSTTSRFDLPLFGGGDTGDDAPLVTPSAVPRPPLSVRRGQPAIARPRAERALPIDEPAPDARHAVSNVVRLGQGRAAEAPSSRDRVANAPTAEVLEPASIVARALAGLVDVLVLGTIDGAILYSTLRIVGLPLSGIQLLPAVPLGVFLLLLNGGYLAIFTTAGGQTIGKMLMGIKVIADRSPEDLEAEVVGHSVTMGASVLRATAYLVSLLPAGLGFAAILVDADGRALHDRLAETRVVKA